MKNYLLKILCLFTILFLASCSSGKFYTNGGEQIILSKNSSFEIKDITIPYKSDSETLAITKDMKDALIKELKRKGLTQNNTTPDVIISGQLLSFDKGNAALRYFIGFGAGKGKVKFSFDLKPNKNQKNIKATAVGSVSMGAFGGSVKTMTTKIAKDIGKKIIAN